MGLRSASTPVNLAIWQDIKEAVAHPELNQSGEEFVLTEQGKYIVARLRSEEGLSYLGQCWMWQAPAPEHVCHTGCEHDPGDGETTPGFAAND